MSVVTKTVGGQVVWPLCVSFGEMEEPAINFHAMIERQAEKFSCLSLMSLYDEKSNFFSPNSKYLF